MKFWFNMATSGCTLDSNMQLVSDRASKPGKAEGALEEIDSVLTNKIFTWMDSAPHAAEQDHAAKPMVTHLGRICFKTCPQRIASTKAACGDKIDEPTGNLLMDTENDKAKTLQLLQYCSSHLHDSTALETSIDRSHYSVVEQGDLDDAVVEQGSLNIVIVKQGGIDGPDLPPQVPKPSTVMAFPEIKPMDPLSPMHSQEQDLIHDSDTEATGQQQRPVQVVTSEHIQVAAATSPICSQLAKLLLAVLP